MKQSSIILRTIFLYTTLLNGYLLFSQDLVVTTNEIVPAGTYNTITIESGGIATLAGNVTVATSVTVKGGGTLVCGANVIDGAGSFTMEASSVLSFSGATIDANIAVSGTKNYGNDGIFIFTGTGTQNISTGFPSIVKALIINNPDTVYRLSQIEIKDSLVIYTGMLNLNNQRLVINNNVSIINYSLAPLHRFTIRVASSGKVVTIGGTQKLVVSSFDTQQSGVKMLLQNDLEVAGTNPRWEKGSWIDLNGYNMIFGSAISAIIGYPPPHYISFDNGGTIVCRFAGGGSTKTLPVLVGTSNVKNVILTLNSGTCGANAYISYSYIRKATDDSATATDYLSAYYDVKVNDIVNPVFKIDFYYDDSDIFGNEGLLTAQKYVSGVWSELDGVIAISTNNIIFDSLTGDALLSARTGTISNQPNLIIDGNNSSQSTPFDLPDGNPYDTIIIKSGGYANVTAAFTINTLILDTAGLLNCNTYVISGVNFIMNPQAVLGIGSTDGISKSKGTTGNIQFVAANYSRDGYFWYNGTAAQSLGAEFAGSSNNIGNLIIDNSTQVTIGNDVFLGRTLVLRKGKINSSSRLQITGANAQIVNNAGYKALGNMELMSNNVNDGKVVKIMGDSTTYIKSIGVDQTISIQLFQNVTVETCGDGFDRGTIVLGGKKLTVLPTALQGDTLFDMGKIVVDDQGTIEQVMNSTVLGKNKHYRTYVGTSSIPLRFNLVAGTLGSNPLVQMQVVNKKYPQLPDTNNCIKRYLDINIRGVESAVYNAQMTYLAADVVGNIYIMKGGLYNGTSWIETGVTLTTSTKKIDAVGMTDSIAVLTAGELNPVGLCKVINANTQISVYPVPTSGILNVCGAANATLTILNALGQQVAKTQTQSNNATLDITGQPDGLYVIVIETEGAIISKKVRKQ